MANLYEIYQDNLLGLIQQELGSGEEKCKGDLILSARSARTIVPLSRARHGKISLSTLPSKLREGMLKVTGDFTILQVRLDLLGARPALDIKWTLNDAKKKTSDSDTESETEGPGLEEKAVASFLSRQLANTKKAWKSGLSALRKFRRKEILVLEAQAVMPVELQQALALNLKLPQTHQQSLERLLQYAKTFQGGNTPQDIELKVHGSIDEATNRQRVELVLGKLRDVLSDEITDLVLQFENEQRWSDIQEFFDVKTCSLHVSMLLKWD